jgi:hypothetical protein
MGKRVPAVRAVDRRQDSCSIGTNMLSTDMLSAQSKCSLLEVVHYTPSTRVIRRVFTAKYWQLAKFGTSV